MTYFIDPFGCVKNQVDAENMMARLNKSGWTAAENTDDADLIIINSCGFIESAKQESINAVLGWRKLYPRKKILLAGCLAQRYAEELSEALPEADGLFGISNLGGIAEKAESLFAANARTSKTSDRTGVCKTDSGKNGKTAACKIQTGKRPLLSLPGSAYIKIGDGCCGNGK